MDTTCGTEAQDVPSNGEAPWKAYHRIILNLPHPLAERLRRLAAREHRTISAQVRVFVERALDESAA
jgi:hypothetical protein